MTNIHVNTEKNIAPYVYGAHSLNYYRQIICQDLVLKQNYNNVMELPSLNKIYLNTTSSLFVQDKKYILPAIVALELITGQKIKYTLAKKSISSFKIRQNQLLGCKITLRNQYLYNFFSKFLVIIAPRIRDFSFNLLKNEFFFRSNLTKLILNKSTTNVVSLSKQIVQNNSYFTIGIKNFMIFPELENHFELFEVCRGLNITFGISSKKNSDALLLFSAFQIPITTL